MAKSIPENFQPRQETTTAPVEKKQDSYVQYTGGASTRQILRREWEQAGVGQQEDSKWTVQNRHLLPIEDFSESALDRLLSEDGFRIVSASDVS